MLCSCWKIRCSSTVGLLLLVVTLYAANKKPASGVFIVPSLPYSAARLPCKPRLHPEAGSLPGYVWPEPLPPPAATAPLSRGSRACAGPLPRWTSRGTRILHVTVACASRCGVKRKGDTCKFAETLRARNEPQIIHVSCTTPPVGCVVFPVSPTPTIAVASLGVAAPIAAAVAGLWLGFSGGDRPEER